jgi:tubby-related protein 1
MLGRIKDRNLRDLQLLINKPPRWNEQIGAYVLNFNGRVTMASVKNFQLVDPDEQNAVVLQFGRTSKDDFTMDLQWPLSPLQGTFDAFL